VRAQAFSSMRAPSPVRDKESLHDLSRGER
jgi:hypothetical protein